jgi:hypothetical protein
MAATDTTSSALSFRALEKTWVELLATECLSESVTSFENWPVGVNQGQNQPKTEDDHDLRPVQPKEQQ